MIFTIVKSVMVLFSAGFFKRGLAAMYTSRFPESFPAGYEYVVMLAVGKMLKYKRCMLTITGASNVPSSFMRHFRWSGKDSTMLK